VNGTKLVIDNALQAGIKRFIHISSIHAFKQQPEIEILDELAAAADEKSYAYGRSKYAGQQIALAANSKGMEVLVINPTSIIGPYDFKPSLMGKAIIDLYKRRLPFIFDGGFNYCDSRDVANGIINAVTMGKPGEVYLLAGQWHSLRELTQILSAASSKKINPVALSLSAGKLGLPFIKLLASIQRTEPLYTTEVLDALFKDNRNISSDKAKAALGYTSRPFEETIRDTFHWFKNNGYLD
jgi:dihydroflavonol-4-reductase